MIQAEVHSDDFVFETEFDSTEYFWKASDKEILDLARCGWGGDYPGDDVARFFAGPSGNSEVQAVLDYCRRKSGIGFECHVDGQQAMRWLEANKPELAKTIAAEMDVESGPPGP